MKKILITGGAGFIGSHTADALLEKGYHVRVLDILDPQIHGETENPPAYLNAKVEFVKGDVRDRAALEKALDGVEAVFHFAACTGVGQSMYQIHQYVDINIGGTAMLLDVLANNPGSVKKVVLSSSRAVYGEGEYRCMTCGIVHPGLRDEGRLKGRQWEMTWPSCGRPVEAVPTREEAPQKPISIYAITKKVQEELLNNFSMTYGIPSVVLRYFNVYGTRQALRNPYTGIAAIFTARVLSGRPIPIYEDGKPERDFVHVRDVVAANLLALENPQAGNGAFNVGTGEVLTVKDLALRIR
ncbi:MAG: SDR family NAD(P)-dependent oxidoreductase, partial [Nitrospirae bacterium]|nr:SDR family NAD(P)-dependent oxidoreductase [Nitrospirota bacterium]